MWTKNQIKNHQEAAKRLKKIIDLSFAYIRLNKKSITEKEVQVFIYEKIKELDLFIDKTPVIVAFGSSSSDPHYNPDGKSNRKLRSGDIIMIDLWGRLNKIGAPFADITWMGYCGRKMPKEMEKVFNIVLKSRDEGIRFIKNELKKGEMPIGKEIDKIVRDYIHQNGYGDKFIHGTGHSLGFHGPHGNMRLLRKNAHRPLHKNVAYTIEPGIYLEDKFGIRSEMDFYISNNYKFVATTVIQRKIFSI